MIQANNRTNQIFELEFKMTEQGALAAIQMEIEKLKEEGQTTVDLEPLLELIARLRSGMQSDEFELARRTALAQLEIEAHKGREADLQATRQFGHDSSMEVFRSVITAGQQANKIALAINGGAALVLLALLGHLVANASPRATVASVTQPMEWFVVGVLAAAMSAGLTYLAQYCFGQLSPRWDKAGNTANVGAMITWLMAVVSFGTGAFMAASAFTQLG